MCDEELVCTVHARNYKFLCSIVFKITRTGGSVLCSVGLITNRPFSGGVASRLATAIYVAMVTPILYDNSYSPNDSNLKYESYRPYG